MSKKEIEIKAVVSLEEAVAHLRSLADCLAQGQLVLQKGAEFVQMAPTGPMDLEMEAFAKKGREKLSLELSWWRVGQNEIQPSDLSISTQPPAPPVEAAPEAAEASPGSDAPAAPPAAAESEEPGKGKGHRQSGK